MQYQVLKAVEAKLAEAEATITVLNDKIIIQPFQSFIVVQASQPTATTAPIATAAETPGQLQITLSSSSSCWSRQNIRRIRVVPSP